MSRPVLKSEKVEPRYFDDWTFCEEALDDDAFQKIVNRFSKQGAALCFNELIKDVHGMIQIDEDGEMYVYCDAWDGDFVWELYVTDHLLTQMKQDPNEDHIGAVERLLAKMKEARASKKGN